ncbi:probable F-box protein At4g22165 [Jatropha curcas]|uniref:probable F-box protein At4g22165 n=1 Tax=Jatropha curcas TaxID=180498 RepID=UPI0005FC007A|nr:probable F-box protein At4g22165 [Jatropha curcas]
MAIYRTVSSGENIAFCRSGDIAWSTIPETSPVPHYRDIMFYAENAVSTIHFADPPPFPLKMGYKQWYLGLLNEDLLLLGRFRKYRVPGYEYQTSNFVAYKLDMSTSIWSELHSLGDRILLLGWNCFHSISASDYANFKGNCIYFTDDKMKVFDSNPWEVHDFVIFDLVRRLGLPSYPIKALEPLL